MRWITARAVSSRVALLAVAICGLAAPLQPSTASAVGAARRVFPPTTAVITVFADQLASSMTEAQYQFAATHYVGTQKMLRRDADHLRRYNPQMLVLHYRLPIGESDASVKIIDGNQWITDYPYVNKHESWFYHVKGSREFMVQWQWYLMNPAASDGWRTYWLYRVHKEMADNHDDGVFADSCSVPNYFGGSAWKPPLPNVAPAFEAWWSQQITAFLSYAHAHFNGAYLIPNAGSWITSRDKTDYSPADGVMIEGFSESGAHSPFALSDWQLQMNRILSLENKNRIIIAQNYLASQGDWSVRRFYLANYLLIKGTYTYVNYFANGLNEEWYPEYGVPIGSPAAALPSDISAYYNSAAGVYARPYSNGLVVVNPGTTAATLPLTGTYYLVTPVGGGTVPPDGKISGWSLTYTPVTSVNVAPNDAAILVRTPLGTKLHT